MVITATQGLLAVLWAVVGGVWPLAPPPDVVAGFDPPAQRWEAGHRGVDLLGAPGQPVRAAVAGTVSYAGLVAGRGVVAISHGDTRTTYQPVAATVTVGDRVTAGQPVGTLQTGGSHCRPRVCLHWGLLRGETYLDPLTLVGPSPVRLLPLFSPLPRPHLPWMRARTSPWAGADHGHGGFSRSTPGHEAPTAGPGSHDVLLRMHALPRLR